MLVVLLIALNAAALAVMFIYFSRRIERRLKTENMAEGIRRELNGVLLELNQATERNIALIEDRIAALREILDTADKRLLVMKRETEKQDVSTRLYNDILQRRPAERKTSLQEEVLDLHRKGLSAELIAAKLKAGVGEVELIISLQGRKDNP